MSTYLLVHGSWHGAWCWYRIVARLRRASQVAFAPDLLSLGCDCTSAGTVTLAHWADQIAALVQAAPEPVVLVGHSRGGIVISEVAERVPDRIRVLVYVTAFLLENGQTLNQTASQISGSLVPPAIQLAPDGQSATLRPEVIRDAFYGQCSDEDFVLAQSLLRPEPLAPLATPIRVTETRFGRVPRVYIECTTDRAITHAAQRRMQEALPCRERITLECDHSPFFSRPDELAQTLLRL